MKKILSILMVLTLTFGLVACSSKETKEESKENNKPKQEQAKKESIKMPDKEIGKGKIELSTPGGTSEGGKVPVLMVSKDDQIVQIGLNAMEFDGSKLSYIFVDGEEVAKEQLAETQTSIDLKGSALKAGKHKVEVVQFNNDKKDGKIITYKTSSYECKEK